MNTRLFAVTFLLILSICFPYGADAADLTPAYLEGTWLIGDTEQDCSDPDTEYAVFRKNGTFETGRGGKAEITGFWQISGDAVDLDMVTSPGFFQDVVKDAQVFQGQYYYFHGRMITFDLTDKSFKAVGLLGDEYAKTIAVRCN
jgi:hypothetical protein